MNQLMIAETPAHLLPAEHAYAMYVVYYSVYRDRCFVWNWNGWPEWSYMKRTPGYKTERFEILGEFTTEHAAQLCRAFGLPDVTNLEPNAVITFSPAQLCKLQREYEKRFNLKRKRRFMDGALGSSIAAEEVGVFVT